MESIRWALAALAPARPAKLEDLANWVNTMAALCHALLRAGGEVEEIQAFESAGAFKFAAFWNVVTDRQGVARG